MLTQLRVANFKPFGSDEPAVRIAPITLIYGPNSSGKSSLIHSLLLMNQTLNGQHLGSRTDLVTRGKLVDLGNFSSVLHRHDPARCLSLEFQFTREPLNARPFPLDGMPPVLDIGLSFRAIQVSKKHVLPALDGVQLRATSSAEDASLELVRLKGPEEFVGPEEEEDEDFAREELDDIVGPTGSERRNLFGITFASDAASLVRLARLFERARKYGPYRSSGVPISPDELEHTLRTAQLRRHLTGPAARFLPIVPVFDTGSDRFRPSQMGLVDFLRQFERSMYSRLGGLSYLGPLRTHPARHYVIDGVPGNSVGSRGEYAVQVLYRDRELHATRAPLLRQLKDVFENFQIPYGIDLRNVGDPIAGDVIVLSLTDQRTGVHVGPADVGFGIGQLLPILIEGILAREHSKLVCVEQPEIHLHPRLQAALADFFIATAALPEAGMSPKKEGVQWLLETHSEALVLRLQRRIREGRISHRDVSVLYVDPRGERGASVSELRLDEDGEFIDPWPDGFFVEGFHELMGGR